MRRGWLWMNGLSLAAFGIFAATLVLQSIFGWQVRNDDLDQAGQPSDTYWHYLATGHFGEAVFENWESEFLQMGAYVLLTAYLVQRGSPESKPVDEDRRPADDPSAASADSPGPSRRRGPGQWLYRNSLSTALFGVFVLSFLAHLLAGTAAYNEEQALQAGALPVTFWQFLAKPQFWFQSMQNWQSEFLAMGALIVLSIVLRQQGSPQSKPVTASHGSQSEE